MRRTYRVHLDFIMMKAMATMAELPICGLMSRSIPSYRSRTGITLNSCNKRLESRHCAIDSIALAIMRHLSQNTSHLSSNEGYRFGDDM